MIWCVDSSGVTSHAAVELVFAISASEAGICQQAADTGGVHETDLDIEIVDAVTELVAGAIMLTIAHLESAAGSERERGEAQHLAPGEGPVVEVCCQDHFLINLNELGSAALSGVVRSHVQIVIRSRNLVAKRITISATVQIEVIRGAKMLLDTVTIEAIHGIDLIAQTLDNFERGAGAVGRGADGVAAWVDVLQMAGFVAIAGLADGGTENGFCGFKAGG